MRICSLLPSATEMVFAVGAGDSLVGVSHECDYPLRARELPKVTRSNIPSGLPSDEIDALVSSTLKSRGSLYEVDAVLLDELRPDLILTQRLCEVCAVPFIEEPRGRTLAPGIPWSRCGPAALLLPHLLAAAATRVLVSALAGSGTLGHADLASALRVRADVDFTFLERHVLLLPSGRGGLARAAPAVAA